MRPLAPVLVLLFCVAAAQAQEPPLRALVRKPYDRGAPITISADRMEGYANQETSASGNAELHQDNLSIYADSVGAAGTQGALDVLIYGQY